MVVCFLLIEANAQNTDTSFAYVSGITYQTGSLTELTQFATEQHKDFFVIVYDEADDDGLMNFESMVLQDSSVVRMLNEQTICVKSHIDSDNGKNLTKQYSLDNFPAILLINLKGKLVFSVAGRMDPDQFVDQIKRDLLDQRP